MTVTTTQSVSGPYVANGVQRSWPFEFRVLEADHIRLRIRDADAKDTFITTGIAVDGINATQGVATYPASGAPIAAGLLVYVERIVPGVQPTRYPAQQQYNGPAVERSFDYLTMIVQQQGDRISQLIDTDGGELSISFDLIKDLPSSLAGYGIENAYTKAETGDLLNSVASPLFYKADEATVAFVKTGANALSIKAKTQAVVGGKIVRFDTQTAVVMPVLANGVDYAVYVCADGTVRADTSFLYPAGYTSTTSRKVGGFTYTAGAINEPTIWDMYNPSYAITRVPGRIFIGPQLDANDGQEFFKIVSKDWMETEVGSTSSTDEFVVLSSIGYGAIIGGSRTSDNPLQQSEGTRGIGGIVIADRPGNFSAYAIYGEARRKGNAGWAHTSEQDLISRPGIYAGFEAITTPLLTPQSPTNAQSLTGPWISIGRPDVTDCADGSVGGMLINNAGTRKNVAGSVRIGHVTDQRAIRAANGSNDGSAQGDAFAVGRNHRFGWWNSTATIAPSSSIVSSQTVGPVQQLDLADAGLVHTFGGATSFVQYATTGHVNHLRVDANAAGFAPMLSAEGADVNIDVKISGKGSGLIDVKGTALAGSAGAIAGYATIKYNGTSYKLPLYG